MNPRTWFKQFGWFYLPVSPLGIIVWLLAFIFCFTVFMAVNRHVHSVSDLFYDIFPFFTSMFLLLDWFGSRASGNREGQFERDGDH